MKNQESSRNDKKLPERNNSKLPPHSKLTGTVNFLEKGRNVADTLWSAHILKKTPIRWESTMQNDPLSL